MWIFNLICCIILFAVFLFYDRKKKLFRKTITGEEKFEHYLSELMVAYGKTQNIEEASFEVEEKEEIVLPEEHPYVKEYRAICGIIEEDGDEQTEGHSVFQKNMQYLKEEIRQNLLLCRTKMHGFLGLDLLALFPFFALPLTEKWAMSVSDGLQSYYHGNFGMLGTLILFLATYAVYRTIMWLMLPMDEADRKYMLEQRLLEYPWIQEGIDRYIKKNYTRCLKKNEKLKKLQGFGNVREFLVRKVCFFIAVFFTIMLFFGFYQHAGRSVILTENHIPQYRRMVLDSEQQRRADELYEILICDMINQERTDAVMQPDTQILWKDLLEVLGISDKEEAQKELEKAMISQAERYQKMKMQWYSMMIAMMIACTATLIPEIQLAAREWKIREKRMTESLRLQTVTLLMIHYECITVEDILVHMENFAEIFRGQIAEAVDHFSYHRSKTLQKLKKDIPDEPVQRICDALEFCEELPVGEAFMGLEKEREYFLKKYTQEQNHYQSECVALARMIAYIPFFLLIMVKMVIPFVAEGLSELSFYSQGMQGFF